MDSVFTGQFRITEPRMELKSMGPKMPFSSDKTAATTVAYMLISFVRARLAVSSWPFPSSFFLF